jgi:hypothetical protein
VYTNPCFFNSPPYRKPRILKVPTTGPLGAKARVSRFVQRALALGGPARLKQNETHAI